MASKRRKPMSLDEKREAMLQLFHEACEPFNMKELESRGDKAGVVQQSVKDVVQILVDDKKVETDKIGTGVFYWSFPSTVYLQSKNRVEEMQRALDRETATAAALSAKAAAMAAERGDGPERVSQLAELEALKARKAALTKELADLREFDPEVLRDLAKKAKASKEAADRWTDGAWVLKSTMVKKWGKDPTEVDTMLGIGPDFDYVE